jgi:hypothetical protein
VGKAIRPAQSPRKRSSLNLIDEEATGPAQMPRSRNNATSSYYTFLCADMVEA